MPGDIDAATIAAMDEQARDELAAMLFDRRVSTFGRSITFSAPTFPAAPYEIDDHVQPGVPPFLPVSLTGEACALQCDHCRGSLLRAMLDGSGGSLETVLERAIATGTRGFLVSGGAGTDGKVPVREHAGVLARLKARHGITILAHTGFMDDEDMDALASIPVDGAMFDVCGSRDTLAAVCHLDKDPEDFVAMVRGCKDREIPVMPHVVAGLHRGEIRGETRAVEMLAAEKPDALVLVVLMPVPGTPVEGVLVDPRSIDPLLLLARHANPSIPVQLGCAKPPGPARDWLERRAVDCGFNGIAYPLQETVDHARARGLAPAFTSACCTVTGHGW